MILILVLDRQERRGDGSTDVPIQKPRLLIHSSSPDIRLCLTIGIHTSSQLKHPPILQGL